MGERRVSMMCGARPGRVRELRARTGSEAGAQARAGKAERHVSTMCEARPGRVRELRARTGSEAGAQARAGKAERHVSTMCEARPGRVRELRARTGNEAVAQARAGKAERHMSAMVSLASWWSKPTKLLPRRTEWLPPDGAYICDDGLKPPECAQAGRMGLRALPWVACGGASPRFVNGRRSAGGAGYATPKGNG